MGFTRQKKYKVVCSLLAILMVLSLLLPGIAGAAGVNSDDTSSKISEKVLSQFAEEKSITFLVKFKEQANTVEVANQVRNTADKRRLSSQKLELAQREAVIEELKATAASAQKNVTEFLKDQEAAGNVEEVQAYHIVNGMAVTATKEVAEELANYAEVEKILPNEIRQLNTAVQKNQEKIQSSNPNVEWNVEHVRAPEVWDLGVDGSETVVAVIDSGVDWNHPALKEKYRGYDEETGAVNHTYSWFDATANEDEPYDDIGHGTHVTGTIVGSEPDGSNQIGVAPGAKWIGVKAFATNSGTDADLLRAAEWILAPGGRADLAPDVVNNSWAGSRGMDEWYRQVVQNWRAAQIFPEFSAGNTDLFNPGGPESIPDPANYPESFATGAVDVNNHLANFSLRGPSPYGEVKPDISAPGVNIRSAVPGGGYEGGWNGTSMAGPAVSGVVALLRSVNPGITVNQIEQVLTQTATPLTDNEYPTTPNNGYGYGLVDAYEAVQLVMNEPLGVDRLSGELRYETAIEISQEGWNEAETVVLARGTEFADALAGVPLAYELDAPILLTRSEQLYEATLEEIERLGASNVVILGGTGAISEHVETELKATGIDVERISGETRFETAANIAKKLKPNETSKIVVANGRNFPDAMSIAAHAAKNGMPILLTREDSLPEATRAVIDDLDDTTETIVVGGYNVVEEHVFTQLPNALRLRGEDRYATNLAVNEHFGVTNKHLYVATGREYADALTGAVLAAKNDSTILLVGNNVPPEMSEFIVEHNTNRITIFGGTGAVSTEIEKELGSNL